VSDYNGWRNRETWLCNIWFLDGIDEPMTADQIKEMVEDYVEEQLGGWEGFIADFIDLDLIDYDELAENTRHG